MTTTPRPTFDGIQSSPETNELLTVVQTALAAAAGDRINDGLVAFTVPEGATLETVDVLDLIEKHGDGPRRKTGDYHVADSTSFIAYVDKHGDTATEVWADLARLYVTAVLNAHGSNGPAWEDHHLHYVVQKTPAWNVWAANDGKLMGQGEFAELIEQRMSDVVRPVAADMLELAQTFEATIGVKFESSKLLDSGQRQLEYREQVDARAGQAGRMEIPKDFDIAVSPFEGADPYRITARLRYRINDGVLRLGYKLERPEDVLRSAFTDVVDVIRAGVEPTATVFLGSGA